jgi:hypothetical protein
MVPKVDQKLPPFLVNSDNALIPLEATYGTKMLPKIIPSEDKNMFKKNQSLYLELVCT